MEALRTKLEHMNIKAELSGESMAKIERRRVEEYGAIRWLKEKQVRDKIEKEMIERCRE